MKKEKTANHQSDSAFFQDLDKRLGSTPETPEPPEQQTAEPKTKPFILDSIPLVFCTNPLDEEILISAYSQYSDISYYPKFLLSYSSKTARYAIDEMLLPKRRHYLDMPPLEMPNLELLDLNKRLQKLGHKNSNFTLLLEIKNKFGSDFLVRLIDTCVLDRIKFANLKNLQR